MTADQSTSLGDFLRHERERRGMTIEQVASATKISVRLLHSLESDQYADLPAKPFIRGFVTSYARFIGLDPREVLTRFNDFIDQKSHDRPNREGGHSGYAFEKREGDQSSRTILGAVMGGFVVLGGIVFIFLKPSLKHHRGSHVDRLKAVHSPVASTLPSGLPSGMPGPAALVAAVTGVQASATEGASPMVSAAPAALVTPLPSPSASPSPLASATPSPSASPVPNDPLNTGAAVPIAEIKHKAVFRALESVWVRYQVDDRKVMQFILKKDKILVLRALSTIKFQTANPKLISFSYNGKAAQNAAAAKEFTTRQNDATAMFPLELAEKIQEPFPGQKSLAGRVAPMAPAPTPSVSPIP